MKMGSTIQANGKMVTDMEKEFSIIKMVISNMKVISSQVNMKAKENYIQKVGNIIQDSFKMVKKMEKVSNMIKKGTYYMKEILLMVKGKEKENLIIII